MSKHQDMSSISIYYASAGSGKTYTLVKEYLKILLQSSKIDTYKRILAVTFTNKAVNEMKTRILESLYGFSLNDPEPKIRDYRKVIASEIGKTEEEVQRKAAAIVKQLTHNYAAFDVMTLDKFTHRIIRTFAVDFDLPVNFDVTLDTQTILQEALDRVIAEAGSDELLTAILMEHISATVEVGKHHRSFQHDLLREAELITKDDHKANLEELKDLTMNDFRSIQKQLRERVKMLNAEIEQLAIPVQQHFEQIVANGKVIRANAKIYKHIRTITTADVSEKYETRESVPLNAAFKNEHTFAEVDRLIANLQPIYQAISRRARFQLVLDKLLNLMLLLQIRQQYKEVQKERDEIPLADFNEMIAEHLQKQPALFIYERIGGKYDHFFIDEFQDTSVLQWNNLVPLIDNTTAGMSEDGTKGTLLLVGDPKQAIYRWRGGKAEMLQDLASQTNVPFTNPDVKTTFLDTNYRSFNNVIEFNNAFFDFANQYLIRESTKELYKTTATQKTNAKTGGSARITIADAEDHDLHTLEAIQHFVNQGFKYQDIAILCNKKKNLKQTADFLLSNQIPILSAESLFITASAEVNWVVSLLELLYNSDNKMAQFEFLFYLSKQQTEYTVDAFLEHHVAEWQKTREPEFPKQFEFPASFNTLRLMSVYSIVSLASKWLHDLKKSTFSDAYLQTFADTALNCESRGITGLQDFLEFLKTKNGSEISVNPPPGTNAVNMMTVHKSKGLEFPVVIYPYAFKDVRSMPENFWVRNNKQETDLPATLLNTQVKAETLDNEGAQKLQDVLEQKETDLINQYYVALTRAEEHLHIITIEPFKNSKHLFSLQAMLSDFSSHFNMHEDRQQSFIYGSDTTAFTASTAEISVQFVPVNSGKARHEAIKIADRAALLWGTTTEVALAKGVLIHDLLSKIHTINDIDNILDAGVQTGVLAAGERPSLQQKITQIVAHQELSDFFNANFPIKTESRILGNGIPILKPDRVTFLSENEVALLDYKTGSREASHKKQLEQYAEALSQMGYSVVKKVLVYTGAQIEIITL